MGKYANILLGIGYLAKEHRLDRAIKAVLLNQLLEKIITLKDLKSKLRSKEYCNILLGIGYVAKGQLLKGKIDARLINQIMRNFLSCEGIEPLSICNVLLAVGYLAKENNLHGVIKTVYLDRLLSDLNQCDHVTLRHRSSSVLGVGYIAKGNHLDAKLDARLIENQLISCKESDELDLESFSNILLGAGYIAKLHYLDGSINAETIHMIFTQILKYNSRVAMLYSNAILGVGYLARWKHINGTIDAILINQMLKNLMECSDSKSVSYASTVLGLGYLCHHESLIGYLRKDFFNSHVVIDKLLEGKSILDLSNFLYGLMEIIAYGKFQDIQWVKPSFLLIFNRAAKLYNDYYTDSDRADDLYQEAGKLCIAASFCSQLFGADTRELRLTRRKPVSSQLHLEISQFLLPYLKKKAPHHQLAIEHFESGYFIDSAIIMVDIKIAVEIDGSHHEYTDQGLREFVIEKLCGWKIVHITSQQWIQVKHDKQGIHQLFEGKLGLLLTKTPDQKILSSSIQLSTRSQSTLKNTRVDKTSNKRKEREQDDHPCRKLYKTLSKYYGFFNTGSNQQRQQSGSKLHIKKI